MQDRKVSPYGLTKEELNDLENIFVTPGWQLLIKKVYPTIKDSLLARILDPTKTNDEVNISRGELRALNDYINAPLVAFKIKKD